LVPAVEDDLIGRFQLCATAAPIGAPPSVGQEFLDRLSPSMAAAAAVFFEFVNKLQYETMRKQLLDPLQLDIQIHSIQRGLLRDVATPFDAAFRAASLLFMRCLARPLAIVPQTSMRLVETIESNLNLCENIPPDLVIWSLMMVLIGTAPDDAKRKVLCSKVVQIFDTTGEKTLPPWNHVKEKLQQIAWVDAVLDHIGVSIWIECTKSLSL
jgi:hypothetical protein